MADELQNRARARRPLLGAALAVAVGITLAVGCIRFFRAARGVFSEQQAAQRVIVVVVTLLAGALSLGLLALAAVSVIARCQPRGEEPEPPAAAS